MANKRVYYAVEAVAFAADGTNTFTAVHGVQSVGLTTKYNLELCLELGQLSLYQNIENIPDIEMTMEKVIDGYPLIYHLATFPSTSASLSGRSAAKTIVGLSVYSDTQNSASGTPIAQCTMSGMFVSSLSYSFQVQGNSTESVTLVGNNKLWTNAFTSPAFTNTDVPLAAEGVNRRQHVIFGSAGCKLPQDIAGITSSGTNEKGIDGNFGAHIQSLKPSVNLGREAMYELGRKGVYFRYVNFPVEVKCDIEVYATSGDNVQALEEADNVINRTILIMTTDSTKIDLGTKNKLASVTYGGGNATQSGGNATITFSFSNYNDCIIQQGQDPSGL